MPEKKGNADMTGKSPGPRGVVAMLTNPEGAVVVAQADFDCAGYGGFSLYEAQKFRCRRAVMTEFIRDFCHPDFARALSGFAAEEAFRGMVRNHGWRLTYIPVGHPEEGSETE